MIPAAPKQGGWRIGAVLLLVAASCSAPGPQDAVRIHTGHVPEYTKEARRVVVAVANYLPVDRGQDLYRAVPGTRVAFGVPAHFLVSKWNLMGGDQESILLEVNSKTLQPWQDCLIGPIHRPASRCPSERPLLVRIWSDLRPAVPVTIRPDLKAFPASDPTSFRGRHVRPVAEAGGFEIVGYDDVWSKTAESRTAYFGKTNLYSSSLFLYPRNYQKDEVKFVDCIKTDSFCKAYMPFRGKWVEFQIYKDQLPEIRQLASGIHQLLSRFSAQ
jgi:hypothetical protein